MGMGSPAGSATTALPFPWEPAFEPCPFTCTAEEPFQGWAAELGRATTAERKGMGRGKSALGPEGRAPTPLEQSLFAAPRATENAER